MLWLKSSKIQILMLLFYYSDSNVKQFCHADEATGASTCTNLSCWWDMYSWLPLQLLSKFTKNTSGDEVLVIKVFDGARVLSNIPSDMQMHDKIHCRSCNDIIAIWKDVPQFDTKSVTSLLHGRMFHKSTQRSQ